jgi:O-antigen/teichoic acid export membrane protein
VENLEELPRDRAETMNDERGAVVELVVGSGVAALLSLGYIVYAGRVLGPVEYADVSAALAVLYFFSMAFSPVMPTISRFVAMYSLRNDTPHIVTLHDDLVRRVLRWTAVPAIVALLCAVPLQRLFHFRSAVTLVLTIACIVVFVSLSVDRGVLQGLARFRDYNISTILESSIRLLGAVVLLAIARNAAVALASYVAGLLIANVLLRLRLRRDWRGVVPQPVDIGEVMRFAGPMLLLMMAFAVQQNADMLAAKRWLPAAIAGSYGAASGLARSFAVITAPFFILIIPRITALHENGKPIAGASLRICGWFLLISSLPLAAFWFLGEPIISHSYGPQFGAAAPLLLPLSLLAIVSNLGLLVAQAFASAHRFWILRVYVTGALAEVAVLMLAHSTAETIIRSVLILQIVVVAIMTVMLIASDRVLS